MSKADEAFRTIGEVSEELDVPKHVLRFWEARFPQIKPMKRGGGRRFYRPEDVVLLRGIHHLLHRSGFTIKGVQRILKEQGPDAVKAAPVTGGPGVAPTAAGRPAKAPRSTRKRAELDDPLLRAIRELESCLDDLRAPI
jgi:DNA-binding transcriptional MerR regulator